MPATVRVGWSLTLLLALWRPSLAWADFPGRIGKADGDLQQADRVNWSGQSAPRPSAQPERTGGPVTAIAAPASPEAARKTCFYSIKPWLTASIALATLTAVVLVIRSRQPPAE